MQTPEEPPYNELFGLTSYDHEGSGTIDISSGAEFNFIYGFERQFPWNIASLVEAEFTAPWNVGSGDLYWYRVEGECERLSCKVNNVRMDPCPRNILTVVAARSLSELCNTLRSPSLNAPLKWRLKSIAKYSRPVSKDLIVEGECNVLDEQDFCQVAECFEYCIDQDVILRGVWSDYVVEDITLKEMTGILNLSGAAQTNRRFEYTPGSSLLEFGGSFDSDFSFVYQPDSGISIAGSAEARRMSSELEITGSAQVISPSRTYLMSSNLILAGSARPVLVFSSSGGALVAGSAECPRLYAPEGRLNFGGEFSYSIPSSFLSFALPFPSSDLVSISDLGVIFEKQVLETTIARIDTEYPVLPEANTLTINVPSVTVSCGCGVLSQSLRVTHNLNSSKVLSNFLGRNALYLPYQSRMGYKSRDKSWRCVEHYSGFSEDGSSKEDWAIFFTLACTDQTWVFTFSARAKNSILGMDKQSKFILEIPASLMCSDNNISTVIRTDINSFVPTSTGVQILVVNSDRVTSSSAPKTRVDISVDGLYTDFVTFYDDLNLFGDSYWQNAPFEIKINPANGITMPTVNLNQIIPPTPVFPT